MVRNKSNNEWRPVQLPKDLVDEVENLTKKIEVRKHGITSMSQFISRAVSEELKRMKKADRLSHVNMYDDHVKILDNGLDSVGRIVSVYFRKDSKTWCDYCESESCVHVQFSWEIPKVRDILLKHGFRPPPSRA